MDRKLQILRGETELGELPESEVRELLRAGFLLPTDQFRTDATAEAHPLSELSGQPERESESIVTRAKRHLTGATEGATSHFTKLSKGLKSLVKFGGKSVNNTTTFLLDSFMPQLQKLVSAQLIKTSVTRVQAAVKDDEFMRKFFGAIYDCLPKPVGRFVSEAAFLEYCLARRRVLLGLEATDAGAEVELTNPS